MGLFKFQLTMAVYYLLVQSAFIDDALFTEEKSQMPVPQTFSCQPDYCERTSISQ
jgi:hypothetical protein